MRAWELQLREIDEALNYDSQADNLSASQEVADRIIGLEYLKSEIQRNITFQPNSHTMTTEQQITFECVACNELFPLQIMVNCTCEHRYCHSCAIELVQSSLSDINLFPPRCCGTPLPLETKWRFMTTALWEKFEKRKLETSGPPPTYCWTPSCANLLLPENITNSVGTCPKCHKRTCTKCKEKTHIGSCAGGVYDHLNVTEFILKNGWKRCPKCGRGIERIDGCPHMLYEIALYALCETCD